MKITDILVEYNSGLLRQIKSVLPRWPDYVIKDWLYSSIVSEYFKKGNSPASVRENIRWQLEYSGLTPNTRWQLVNFDFVLDDRWDKKTKDNLLTRMNSVRPYINVPRDQQRHSTQSRLLAKRGISREPVIIIKTRDGYELVEGWHRTVQNFKMYPDGYVGPAWVAEQN